MASIKKRENGQWRARYRDEGGREHSRHFTRKADAQRWLDETTASVVTGQYVDPKAGRVTVREYAEQWRAAQVHREGTVDHEIALEGTQQRLGQRQDRRLLLVLQRAQHLQQAPQPGP